MTYKKRYGILGTLLIILIVVTVIWEKMVSKIEYSDGEGMESLCFVVGNTVSEQKIYSFTDESEQTDYLFLPSYANDVRIFFGGADRVVFTREGEEISLKSGESIEALTYDEPYDTCFYDREGNRIEGRTMVVMHSANLPTLFLETQSGSMEALDADKNYEEKGRICLFGSGGG